MGKIFQMSKKNFKRALGMLMKQNVIKLENGQIALNKTKIDLEHYDVGKEIERKMWQSKPIWEYGVNAPPFSDALPQEIKQRNKKMNETYEKKQSLRKIKS